MPLPNLLIVGAQKSGTTWLHHALRRSRAIFGSQPKELNHFNRANCHEPDMLRAYADRFPDEPGVPYRMESTPHYFRLPFSVDGGMVDVAANVQAQLDDPKLLLMLRDPVDRYESHWIHILQKGDLHYVEELTLVTDYENALAFGRYAEILSHWQAYFSGIEVFLYDDLVADPGALMDDVMGRLGLENDLEMEDLAVRVNDKHRKANRFGLDWPRMPRLSEGARHSLREHYRPDTARLQDMIGRDLSSWLADD